MDRIVFLDRETLAPRIELRRPRFAHELIEHARTSPEQVVERLRGASIAITNKVALREAQLRQLPGLRLIAVAATGTDCIDKAWCAAHAIPVCNIRGYAVHTVPEHTFALILALRRGLVPYRRDVLAGRWQRAGQFCFFDHPIADLGGGVHLRAPPAAVLAGHVVDVAVDLDPQPPGQGCPDGERGGNGHAGASRSTTGQAGGASIMPAAAALNRPRCRRGRTTRRAGTET